MTSKRRGNIKLSPILSIDELNKLKSIAEKYGQKLYPPGFLGE